MKALIMPTFLACLLTSCTMLPGNIDTQEEKAMTIAVASAERVICRDIPIGTWIRLYGSNAERVAGWKAICIPTKAVVPVVPSTPQE